MANMAFHTYQTTSSINNLGSSHDPTSSQQQAAFEQSAAAAQQAAQAAFLQQQAQNQQSQPQMNQVPIPPHKVEFKAVQPCNGHADSVTVNFVSIIF